MENVRLITCKWDELDLDEVSRFVFDNRVGIYRNAVDSEAVVEYLSNMQKRFPSEIIFMVRKNEELLAWAALDRDGESLAELGRWQPIVGETSSKDTIADMMLNGIFDYSRETGINRLEAVFNNVDTSSEADYLKSANWFNKNGFPKIEDDAYLTMDLSQTNLEPRRTPDNLSFESLEGIDVNVLYECYYDSFTSGMDTEFLDMNDEQRKSKFDKSFKKASLNLDLSSVLKEGEKIVGFAFVHKREDEEHIDRFGIRKEYRGKGHAKAHLLHVVHEAKERKTPLMSIGVDTSNTNAYNLYKNVGFGVESRAIIHSWKAK